MSELNSLNPNDPLKVKITEHFGIERNFLNAFKNDQNKIF